jgi:DNA-directed RNA polymerase specialized sigma subunit
METIATYRDASPLKRRQIQTEVVSTYRPHVARMVRGTVAPRHREEAEQVGLIGLLVGLERFDPERATGPDVGAAFWTFARGHVKDEIQKWMDHGVYWRPRRARKTVDEEVMKAHRRHVYVDDIGQLAAEILDVETQVANAEGLRLVGEFLRTLSDDERHLLLCEKRSRGPSADSPYARRCRALFERATKAVKGGEKS